MPQNYVKALAKKKGISVEKAEKYWQDAKASAKKQGKGKNFGYVTGIFKKMMHVKESIEEPSDRYIYRIYFKSFDPSSDFPASEEKTFVFANSKKEAIEKLLKRSYGRIDIIDVEEEVNANSKWEKRNQEKNIELIKNLESVDTPDTFQEYFSEAKRKDTAVFNFGKYRVPTIAHQMIMQSIVNIAENNNADAYLFASQKVEKDSLETPLTFSEKIRMLSQIAPSGLTIVKEQGDKTNTMFAAVEYLARKGYKKIIMVVGSDRFEGADEVPKEKLQAKLTEVKPEATIEFIMAGKKRRNSGSGVEAASSSAAIDAFKNKDKVKFMSIVPKVIAKTLWNILREKKRK